MSYDGYFEFNGSELVNLSRTAQLAESLNIYTLWVKASNVAWIQTALGGSGYASIANAPWYDAAYPASQEFAGLVPLSVAGLDDSSLESTPIEYITDGGHSGKPRNATQPLVWSVAIIASTERGAEYGKRWLDRRLRDSDSRPFCSGAELEYFRTSVSPYELVHRRDVRLTRGTSVTRKRKNSCSSVWMVTFTMTAADPFEYGEPQSQIVTNMGSGGTVTGPGVASSGVVDLEEEHCPVYDYTPIYDPDYPALVVPPTPPNFLPDGWPIEEGMLFRRYWVRLQPVDPVQTSVVPYIRLSATSPARGVRFSVFPYDNDPTDLCGALFTAINTYLPEDLPFYIDGEAQAVYAWDGFSPAVRRSDSLVYGIDAAPLGWSSFNDPDGLLVALDVFFTTDSDPGLQGEGSVRATLSLVAKSD